MDFHSERRMPSAEGPLPTKGEMHSNRQISTLTCRETAQFNKSVRATRDGVSSSAIAVDLIRPACPSLERWTAP
jgi:hypothetical protein